MAALKTQTIETFRGQVRGKVLTPVDPSEMADSA